MVYCQFKPATIMRQLLLLFMVCLFTLSTILIVLLAQAIESEPKISRQVTITPEYIARAKQIIETHYKQANPKNPVTVSILSSDVDVAANYLVYRFTKGSASVSTDDGSALIQLSVPLPTQLFEGYLNLEATLIQGTRLPELKGVRIGNLQFPDYITTFLVSQLSLWAQSNSEFRLGVEMIKQINMSLHEISVTYQHWLAGLSQHKNGSPLISQQVREQLLHYQTLLAENSRHNHTTHVTLSEILSPLMHHAATYPKNNNPITENRAVILVTTFHVMGISLKNLLPEAENWPKPVKQRITLDGRIDFPKHFMVSAMIAAYADTILADAIGLYKEIEDSRSGSGFSFNDIAANRAGTRLAEKAVANQASAQQMQQKMMSGLTDSDLMPHWKDLPEHMHEAEFKARFGGIDSPAYKEMMQEIEVRASALPILN